MFHISRENDERFVRGSFGTSREGALLSRLSESYWRMLGGGELGAVEKDLLQECLLDPNEAVWRRACLAGCRLADHSRAFSDYWLRLADHPDLQIRLRQIEFLSRTPRALADRLILRLADDPSRFVRLTLVGRLGEVGTLSAKPLLREMRKLETGLEIKDAIGRALRRLASRHSRRRSARVFKWNMIANELYRYSNFVIDCVRESYPETTFDAGSLDCNAAYAQVLISFNAAPAGGGLADRWDIGDWSHFDMGELLRERRPGLARHWQVVAEDIAKKISDPEILWADGENPVGDFMRMATEVAIRLETSPALLSLSRSVEFGLLAIDHDEFVVTAFERTRLVREQLSSASSALPTPHEPFYRRGSDTP